MKSDRLKFGVALVAFLGFVGFLGLAFVPWVFAQDMKVSIRDLKRRPGRYAEKKVVVRGKLRLGGRNYFTDPRFVLVDGAGNQIEVNAWVPLEVPPPMPGHEEHFAESRPSVMEDYLDQNLSVAGIFQRAPGRDRALRTLTSRSKSSADSSRFLLKVESATKDQRP